MAVVESLTSLCVFKIDKAFFLQLLKILQQGEIAFTKKDLSDYLGISIRSLNRLLKEN